MITDILSFGTKILDKVIPDPVEKAKAQAELVKAKADGRLAENEQQLKAIVMEAQSSHMLVALARPSFLYVMYIMILASIPAGLASVWAPEAMDSMLTGMQRWLAAIPTEMWALFGTGYLGYTVNREKGKAAMLGQEQKGGWLSKILG